MAPLFDSKDKQISVAFVCLGNICRSPMAEAIFKHKVNELGYSPYFKRIDSFGTGGWHIGQSPDHRSAKTCRKHGVPVNHAAQQILPSDFKDFDYVIAMDESNKSDLLYSKPRESKAVVEMFGKWRTDSAFAKVVADPYYGGNDGFEVNFQQLSHFSEEFLKQEVGDLN
ncbi:LMWPc-domain-containing protein [Suhomyces tanzawaensis NRRL Y-17324]|uniref:LMWPc-domain-containing protein n=1 Tax=Suhomyces tanzawaensis NRRL Y-17324 TaxID=984487 RepID=A0A1E4SN54_9ASCO|nr:LMWPc-domain-containing protein [Suhomyces tanzawaensis NRRL Y-17324]ODV80951.1 LMWPc-domain-containing protein [Suhomyces tanzawaensis NRRL Y-17324]